MAAHTIVSLWDLNETARVHELLEHSRKVLTLTKRSSSVADGPMESALKDALLKEYQALRSHCEDLSLLVSMRQADTIIEDLNACCQEYPLRGVDRAISLVSTIESELKHERFFVLQPDQAKRYLQHQPFGPAVEAAFPSATSEITEAGKCHSLGRYNAAVLHLMRTLEVGLRCLTEHFDVPFAHADCAMALERIHSRITQMSTATHGTEWRELRRFYVEATAYLYVLNNDWSRYTMHSHERYDAGRAKEIYDIVRTFMSHLSTRLRENGQRPA